MESLSSLIQRTIKEGVPLFNDGNVKECFNLYMETTKFACEQEKIAESDIGKLLETAADEAMELTALAGSAGSTDYQVGIYREATWVLRHCFDEILKQEEKEVATTDAVIVKTSNSAIEVASKDHVSDNFEYWQDEKVKAQNHIEEGRCIADIFKIIKESLPGTTLKYGFTTHDNCIRGGDAVDLITSLGLAPNAQVAQMKMNMFQQASIIVPVGANSIIKNFKPVTFRGGNYLYRYGDTKSMSKALQELQQNGPYAAGTGEAALIVALEIILSPADPDHDGFSRPSLTRTKPILGKSRRAALTTEENEGVAIATLSANLEKIVERKDRKWGVRPKVYENCFVGSEAVTVVLNELEDIATREEAVQKLKQLADTGLIYHVTREHSFEDKNLFYAFATPKEIQAMLGAADHLSNAGRNNPTERIRFGALKERYRQFAGLNIDDILNSFYGCNSKDGWDSVDLQNWRNNMKRWGFGRRDDQDDEMVDYLAPLVLNIDPTTWDKTGDEEWESPWGILAQIAIFDQIPRSAFRGTKEAFLWDDLAIRATKVAIEKGYFDTAYKSTLNRFVILLPLEHSESWEDQKLGVKMLLQMLSSVAIEDEEQGHSSYDIVKRLEFSKRLSTAFLEHAQVIAKFKRYPHRNRQHGRTTTLEERIWLASDLVPRWAKSQNEEQSKKGGKNTTKNVISLPVIPLKRLTRG